MKLSYEERDGTTVPRLTTEEGQAALGPFAAMRDEHLKARKLNLNLPRFRLHPYAAFRAAPSRCLASNSAGLRFPSAEWILTLL